MKILLTRTRPVFGGGESNEYQIVELDSVPTGGTKLLDTAELTNGWVQGTYETKKEGKK